MAQKNPILELSTDIQREFLTIDGKKYEIRSKSEMSAVDYHKVVLWGTRNSRLIRNEDELSEEEISKYEKALDDCIDIILIDLPKDILKTLPEGIKKVIIEAFTKLLMANMSEGEIKAAEKEAEKIVNKQETTQETSLQ